MKRRKFVQNTMLSSLAVYTGSVSGISVDSDTLLVNSSSESESYLMKVIDLDIGEEITVTLYDGSIARIKLISIEGKYESVTKMVIGALVNVNINGESAKLVCSSYRLPVLIGGVQVDIPVVVHYNEGTHVDY